jgi:uncharacterized protein YukE
MPFQVPTLAFINQGSGGGATVFTQLLGGGDSQNILGFAQQLAGRIQPLMQLVEQLTQHKEQMQQAWPEGKASENAQQKIQNTIDGFQKAIQTIQQIAQTIEQAGKVQQMLEQLLKSVQSGVDPAVGAMLSNPWTRPAGHATATATVGSLQSIFTAASKLMETIGLGDMSKLFTGLGAITGDFEKLFDSGTSFADKINAVTDIVNQGKQIVDLFDGDNKAAGTVPEVPTIPGAPDAGATPGAGPNTGVPGTGGMPTAYDPTQAGVGTGVPGGQGGAGGYGTGYGMPTAYDPSGFGQGGYDPSGFGAGGAGGGAGQPGPWTQGLLPSLDPTQGGVDPSTAWVPTDPGPGADPTGGDAGLDQSTGSGGQDGNYTTITTTKGDVTLSVEMPTDTPTELSLGIDTDGKGGVDFNETIKVDENGQVTTS